MSDMKYTKDHEWIRFEGEVAVIGITDHAQNALGDVVFVDLPEPGREVTAGEAVAVVESVKAASDVYAPIAGRVTEVNSGLVDEPALINSEPTGAGWFFKITPAGALPDDLMDANAYAAFVESLA
jgi:glycine cleavage system H protein